MYWDDVGHHSGPERLAAFWMAHPAARAAINRRVTGDPAIWPLQWFREQFASSLPFDRVLSIGAGTGELERDLLHKGIARKAVGIDLAGEPLRHAAGAAAAEGFGDVIEYHQADARSFLLHHPEAFDAIFFHGALHHLEGVSEVLKLVRASLRSGGWLYVDEYVGPSMKQWNVPRLLLPNAAYRLLRSKARRPRIVRAPVNPEDPTEMIDSSAIVPAIRAHFHVLEERGYGGNLLGIIYGNLRRDDAGVLSGAVESLVRWEDRLLRVARPHFAVIVARRDA